MTTKIFRVFAEWKDYCIFKQMHLHTHPLNTEYIKTHKVVKRNCNVQF